ncbi:DoxX family protein [Lentzea sp. NEAU-D7]|uniref:DoxX family protein n=1 Tax=Lentzea sp. NEAU-D7 TaxID=2994667 RepID=UPI00224B1F03|nr:DoxX family protein [Lentzea sp. NEAU-D7]MCX2947425.1 DoxX family protein [Lentzea sp. NEAU-D7]
MSSPETTRNGGTGERLARFARESGVPLLRIGLGVVYLWFGVLKLFPGGSPAQDLVERTVSALTFGVVHGDVARMSAAISEIGIALVVLSFRAPRSCAVLLIGHVVLVSTPLVLFPGEMWSGPLQASFEAQYILKNLVTVAAAVVIASSHPRVR